MDKEERIAKLIARAGFCSRRDAEKLIASGRVSHRGKTIDSPAMKFADLIGIEIDGAPLRKAAASKLWLYHKPVGLIVSHQDEQGRETVFDYIPLRERVISVGRLDKNTSGLLLLTNDGNLARRLELPENNFQRSYMVRVYGRLDFNKLQKALAKPITIEGITYRPIQISLEHKGTHNHWLKLTISEGKNREIRRVFEYFELKISKLIRIQYGPFELADLELEAVQEIPNWEKILQNDLRKTDFS